MAKVEAIVDPEFKSGMGKKGAWKLVKVTADGKTATGFAPISIGDEVDLEYNDEYKNWNFKKIGPQDIPTTQGPDDSSKMLELVYDNTSKILALLEKTPLAGSKSLKETWDNTTKDKVVEDIGEEPISLEDIPF